MSEPDPIFELLRQQQHMQEQILQLLAQRQDPALPTPTTQSLEATLEKIIPLFSYAPEENITFDVWFKRYEDNFRIDASALDDSARVRSLLRKLDTPAHSQYINYILPRHPRDLNFDETVRTLTEIFGPKVSLFNLRYKCLQLQKNPHDDIITYGGTVNRECENFRLGELSPDQFKALIFVRGLQSPKDAEYRIRLLNRIEADSNATVKDLIAEYQRLENLQKDNKMLEQPSSCHVSVVSKPSSSKKQQIPTHKTFSKPSSQPKTPCWQCGEMHFVRDCSFSKHKCKDCGRIGHKEGYCNASRNRKPRRPSRKVQSTVQSNGAYCVSSKDSHSLRKYVSPTINGLPVKLQVDTGSDVTILSKFAWKKIGAPRLETITMTVFDASHNRLNLIGEFTCAMELNGQKATGRCLVGTNNARNLLGIDWIQKLNLWDLTAISNNVRCKPQVRTDQFDPRSLYPNVCSSELGHCTKAKASLRLRPDAHPVFRPKRPVPYAALDAVDQELDRLEQQGVISKVNYSEWAAPIVIVKKANGALRICADFSTGLNAALEPHQYPLHLPEEIFATLNNGRFFSQIDLADAYLQVEVDEQSKKLLTINTHRGLYQYNRLPFGVKTAPGIFQQIMDSMLAGLKGATAYLDDILVTGKTKEEHLANLNAVFKRIEEYGFHIRPEKCKFFMPNVEYLGSIIDAEGRRPDPKRIKAIQNMPAPNDIPTLCSFLGMINHYAPFVKEMRDLRAPLMLSSKRTPNGNGQKIVKKLFDELKLFLARISS